jgi:hypothetical protein
MLCALPWLNAQRPSFMLWRYELIVLDWQRQQNSSHRIKFQERFGAWLHIPITALTLIPWNVYDHPRIG